DQPYAIGRLARLPTREDTGFNVVAVASAFLSSIYFISHSEFGQRFEATVAHQNRCPSRYAVNALMFAAVFWVDCRIERNIRRLVARDDGFGALGCNCGLERWKFLFLDRFGCPAVIDRLHAAGFEASLGIGERAAAFSWNLGHGGC